MPRKSSTSSKPELDIGLYKATEFPLAITRVLDVLKFPGEDFILCNYHSYEYKLSSISKDLSRRDQFAVLSTERVLSVTLSERLLAKRCLWAWLDSLTKFYENFQPITRHDYSSRTIELYIDVVTPRKFALEFAAELFDAYRVFRDALILSVRARRTGQHPDVEQIFHMVDSIQH